VNKFTTGSQIGNCGTIDAHCICSSQSFLSDIACCLAGACDAADQATAVAYARTICQTVQVTVPDVVSCASVSTTATATTGAASSAPSSTTAVSTTSSPASASAASASASATKNAGIQNAASVGLSFAGGLAAMLAVL
jgi:hypothetical protein